MAQVCPDRLRESTRNSRNDTRNAPRYHTFAASMRSFQHEWIHCGSNCRSCRWDERAARGTLLYKSPEHVIGTRAGQRTFEAALCERAYRERE